VLVFGGLHERKCRQAGPFKDVFQHWSGAFSIPFAQSWSEATSADFTPRVKIRPGQGLSLALWLQISESARGCKNPDSNKRTTDLASEVCRMQEPFGSLRSRLGGRANSAIMPGGPCHVQSESLKARPPVFEQVLTSRLPV